MLVTYVVKIWDTPHDPLDDTYLFDLLVSGFNTGSGWTADDINSSTGVYEMVTTLGPYLISDGILNFLVHDAIDPSCTSVVSILPPSPCSDECNIIVEIDNLLCNDNETSNDPDDDVFTFNITVSGFNTGLSWMATDPNNTSGSFGSTISFGPFPIASGELSFDILDGIDALCLTTVDISPPSSCSSECAIDIELLEIDCSNNGTPNDPEDDTYTIDVFASGTNIGSGWIVNDMNASMGTYSETITLGPYLIIDGNFTLTFNDQDEGNCFGELEVIAPPECSADCSESETMAVSCDDENMCTSNDVEIVLVEDGSVCVPCAGEIVDCSNGTTTTQSCDDGDENTFDDIVTILDCDGSICEPCMGSSLDCQTEPTTIQPCDDNDPCTLDDVETILDADGSICIPCEGILSDCETGVLALIDCDDRDKCTANDIEMVNICTGEICEPCKGTKIDCDNDLILPNTFSPNEDGNNDEFVISTDPPFPIVSFAIYNRWGNLVFSQSSMLSNDPNMRWNGKFNGQSTGPGVFIYILVYQNDQGEPIKKVGSITIL